LGIRRDVKVEMELRDEDKCLVLSAEIVAASVQFGTDIGPCHAIVWGRHDGSEAARKSGDWRPSYNETDKSDDGRYV